MSDFLLGKEVSGTPLETRDATKQFANLIQQLLRGGSVENMLQPFQQLSMDALMSLMEVPEIAASIVSPADQTRGLFAAMEPFEKRETARQTAQQRNIFGSVGGRFSRNVAGSEALLRGELANQFGRARQEALLTAEGQRKNFLAQLIGAATQQGQTGAGMFGAIADFLRPGAPQFQPGALPGLLSAGSGILAASMMSNPVMAGAGIFANPRIANAAQNMIGKIF